MKIYRMNKDEEAKTLLEHTRKWIIWMQKLQG